MVAEEFPEARLFALAENVGFARAVNLAAEQARGEYLLLLNPDTEVHPGLLDAFLAFARSLPEGPSAAAGRCGRTAASTRIVLGRATLWSLFCFATALSSVFRGTRLFDPESLGGWKRDSVRDVDIVTGCLLFVPSRSGESSADSIRGSSSTGRTLTWRFGPPPRVRRVITPDAVVTHEVGVSSATRPDKLLLLYRGKVTLLTSTGVPSEAASG